MGIRKARFYFISADRHAGQICQGAKPDPLQQWKGLPGTMKFYSHVEKSATGEICSATLLKDHLREVAQLCQYYAQQLPDNMDVKDHVVMLAHHIGLTHDFGKFTSYFQNYLQKGEDSGSARHHSQLSAFWGAFSWYRSSERTDWESLWLIFSAIWCHHGNLTGLQDWIKDYVEYLDAGDAGAIGDIQRLQQIKAISQKQLLDLEKNSLQIGEDLQEMGLDPAALEDFVRQMKSPSSPFIDLLLEAAESWEDAAGSKNLKGFHRRLYLLFSILIDADKRHAADAALFPLRPELRDSLVDSFLPRLPKKHLPPGILRIRQSLYHQLNEQTVIYSPKERIFTLTAPTGSGKTLAVLNFALKIREKIRREKGYLPRIVYALPFTSIIDQNFEVFRQVLEQIPDFATRPQPYLLKHHHLADIRYRVSPGEDLPLDKALLLTESWESEIVVTTFVQLFETLFSVRNRSLKKFHHIAGAILILDEIQNLPVEYWPAVRELIREVTQHFACTAILMTATQPIIFPPGSCTELVENHSELFEQLDRVRAFFHSEPEELDNFANRLRSLLETDRSCAIILNTISSSIRIYNELKAELQEKTPLFYLSTNILPIERKKRIERLNDLLNRGEPAILVTTQVIEAGVDLDFDRVYRDIAPVDSLVQAAGRVNRHGMKPEGELHIVCLKDEHGSLLAHRIYGKSHIQICQELLAGKKQLHEPEFYRLIHENYQRLVRKYEQITDRTIFEAWWAEGRYNALQNFQLIRTTQPFVDVFVEIDEHAAELWQQYKTAVLQEKDIHKRRQKYLHLRSKLRQYVLSIPLRFAKQHFWEETGSTLGYIPNDWVDTYYNPETGFIRAKEEEFIL